jgi:REP element-mobilizing transposase RayT
MRGRRQDLKGYGDSLNRRNLSGLYQAMDKPIPLVPGETYHVYNRGNGGENLCREPRNYDYFLALYVRHVAPVADTFAYCLLGNHFHLVVRIKQDLSRIKQDLSGSGNLKGLSSRDASQAFSNFFNAYTKGLNKTYQRTGSLFPSPFRRLLVTSDAYFLNLVHYIHFNPQKHGFVSDLREYPYSSYPVLCSNGPTWLARDELLDRFNGRASLIKFHHAQVEEKKIAGLIIEE